MDGPFDIVAFSAAEARAIARTKVGLYSVESPYRAGDFYPISVETLATAISRLDFTPSDIRFDTLPEVCDFIETQSAKYWNPPADENAVTMVQTILRHAGASLVEAYLDSLAARVESTAATVLQEALMEALDFDAASEPAIRSKITSMLRQLQKTFRGCRSMRRGLPRVSLRTIPTPPDGSPPHAQLSSRPLRRSACEPSRSTPTKEASAVR